MTIWERATLVNATCYLGYLATQTGDHDLDRSYVGETVRASAVRALAYGFRCRSGGYVVE